MARSTNKKPFPCNSEWTIWIPESPQEWRSEWLSKTLDSLVPKFDVKPSLLDVGAGQAPYKDLIFRKGLTYFSHDFMAYTPSAGGAGLREGQWKYHQPDIVSDILDIPEDRQFDFVLCTDVLEHVPDATRAFRKLCDLTSPGGYLVIIVPLLSIMHQPPFWFQPGLSPQFFLHHLKVYQSMEVSTLSMVGNYSDWLEEEMLRYLELSREGQSFARKVASKGFRSLISPLVRLVFLVMNRFQPEDRMFSASKGVVLVARKSARFIPEDGV